MVWNGIKDDFCIFHTSNFLPFYFHSILKIFHSILKFSSIFYSIFSYQRTFRLEAMQGTFCTLQCCKQPLMKVRITRMQRLVSGMHFTHGFMHKRITRILIWGGPNRKSHTMTLPEIFKKRDYLWDKE